MMLIVLRCVVVLLQNGKLEALECYPEDIQAAARVRDAGICGVFDNPASASAFIAELLEQQSKIPGWNLFDATTR